MGTTLDFIEYVQGQTEGVGKTRYRKMFGEYMLYVNEKPLLLVCDNIAYIKIHPSLEVILQDAEKGCPYNGAKEHYILDVDNRDLVREAILALEPHLKIPKPKQKKQ